MKKLFLFALAAMFLSPHMPVTAQVVVSKASIKTSRSFKRNGPIAVKTYRGELYIDDQTIFVADLTSKSIVKNLLESVFPEEMGVGQPVPSLDVPRIYTFAEYRETLVENDRYRTEQGEKFDPTDYDKLIWELKQDKGDALALIVNYVSTKK